MLYLLCSLEVPASAIRQEKEIQNNQSRKKQTVPHHRQHNYLNRKSDGIQAESIHDFNSKVADYNTYI